MSTFESSRNGLFTFVQDAAYVFAGEHAACVYHREAIFKNPNRWRRGAWRRICEIDNDLADSSPQTKIPLMGDGLGQRVGVVSKVVASCAQL